MTKVVKCVDCQEREAEWFLTYTAYWRWDYHIPRKSPVCTSCLLDVMNDGMMGGGGPTSGDVLKIVPINPRGQRGYSLRKCGVHRVAWFFRRIFGGRKLRKSLGAASGLNVPI